MQQKPVKNYTSLCALLSVTVLHAAQDVAPHFAIRSQGFNSVRRVPGQTYQHAHMKGETEQDCMYMPTTGWLTGEYTRSFRPYDISRALFGESLVDGMLKIQGSRVAGRDQKALLADYFYLPYDFSSIVCFTPRIENCILDLNYYVGLDYLYSGLYFAMQAPITWSKWSLNIAENVINEGVSGFDPGYFTGNTLIRADLNTNFKSYALGEAPGTLTQSSSTLPAPDGVTLTRPQQTTTTQLQPLAFAKMRKGEAKTSLSEIRSFFGWNFLLEDDYHLGIDLQGSIPTGTRPQAEYLFDVQNGNGKHGEFGGGIHGHYTYWKSAQEDRSWTFEFNADVTHLFKTRQERTFDLVGKPLSRYMLAEKMGSDIVSSLQAEDSTAPTAQFKDVITPVANITTFNVDVSVGAQLDLLAMFRYEYESACGGYMTWDLGYNFYLRSCEKIRFECNDSCFGFEEKSWALKGDAQVYGFDIGPNTQEAGSPIRVFGAIPLSATQSAATINGGTNFGTQGVVDPTAILTAKTNPNIDNPTTAFGDVFNAINVTLRVNSVEDTGSANPPINTSIQPVLLTKSDINFSGTKMMTHKIFTKWQYNWKDSGKWTPYIGWGVEAEIAQKHGHCNNDDQTVIGCPTDCDEDKQKTSCIQCGLSQWGMFAQIGVSYR